MEAAVRTTRLSKDYGAGRGLFDLDLEIPSGDVFGYLGPNGAGKTTTIRCLMGMIQPTGGSAQIFGVGCQRDSVKVKKLVRPAMITLSTLAALGYMLPVMAGPLWGKTAPPDWFLDLSVFHLYGSPLVDGVFWNGLYALVTITALGFAVALVAMQRREVGR